MKVFKFRPGLAQSLEEQQRQWAATKSGGVWTISPRRPVSLWKAIVGLAVVALVVAAIIYAYRYRGGSAAPRGVSWTDWTPE